MRMHKFPTNEWTRDDRIYYVRVDLDKISRVDEGELPEWSWIFVKGREWALQVTMPPAAVVALMEGKPIPRHHKPRPKMSEREIQALIGEAVAEELQHAYNYIAPQLHSAAHSYSNWIESRRQVWLTKVGRRAKDEANAKARLANFKALQDEARFGELLRLKNAARTAGKLDEFLARYIERRRDEITGGEL